ARENKIEFAYDYGSLNASYVNEKINFSDDYFQEIINLDFEKTDSSFQQTSSLKPYVLTVIIEKIIIDLEDEVVSLLEKEKANLETIESLKSKDFESSENAISEPKNQIENDCQVVEKECDQVDNSKVIALGMFKLKVSQNVSLISMTKTSCASKNVENKTKRKRQKRKSSKQNDKQVNNDVSRANSDFVQISDLDTFSSVRRPKHSGVIWMKQKWLSNTSSVNLSSVSNSKLNKDVKRYSRKDLLSCNNSHLGETSIAYVCNDAMIVSCNSSFTSFKNIKKDLEDLFQKIYDEYFDASKIMKSSTTNVESSNAEVPSHEEVVFLESSESFQEESSSSSLNDDVQQSSEEVGVPSSNTQSISNNRIPNVDEAITSHNVFNELLEDAYYDASTSFHDPSNVHTFYQPYPHEKKWTKDHLLHKIIGDPKSSVRTRGQLANLCLLISIEPANVVEALRDADWVSAMQEELDQFARLKF
nr:hypothetical protein [Tanacetum cinerariifolium]